ncbi:hypothetical protein LZ32DRAFT_372394 [Colletotrichum eremochloae]|nr:hypothetical protein LZ32DRAFT_372394 [Colletotrichum eremochloae]
MVFTADASSLMARFFFFLMCTYFLTPTRWGTDKMDGNDGGFPYFFYAFFQVTLFFLLFSLGFHRRDVWYNCWTYIQRLQPLYIFRCETRQRV